MYVGTCVIARGHQANVCTQPAQIGGLRTGRVGPRLAQRQSTPRAQGPVAPLPLPAGQRSGSTERVQMQGKAFTVTAAEGSDTVQGILSLHGHDVRALFDISSTHSFIVPHLLHKIPISYNPLPYDLSVSTSGGTVLIGSEMVRDCEIGIHDQVFLGDLIVLAIQDFNLLLGKDWLSRHYARVDCRRKVISFENPR
ncbi:uncharacterized protein LOC127798353 [Diospyros lotus]|uniref:uncharacterized protein LOC127798353 n=1 Tax=Diospyros lotus TaxID=55363 RepID=UPI002259DFDD|nr:uncharacterized protein LOC127798353 [Diospyros lotus]